MTDMNKSEKVSEEAVLRGLLERCRCVLNSMACENEDSESLAFWRSRWAINHEPLRADAKNLLPEIDAALLASRSRPQEDRGASTVPPSEQARAALAYALWDSENSIRMRADCIDEHLERADRVLHWLQLHGCKVVPLTHPTQAEPAVTYPTDPYTLPAILRGWAKAFRDNPLPSDPYGSPAVFLQVDLDAAAACIEKLAPNLAEPAPAEGEWQWGQFARYKGGIDGCDISEGTAYVVNAVIKSRYGAIYIRIIDNNKRVVDLLVDHFEMLSASPQPPNEGK